MIAEPRKTGLIGEMRASRYLRAKGYEIYSANYRSKSGEIDLIAEKDGVLCFVEVKTRRESAYFTPAEAVDRQKEENVKSTAASFLAATMHPLVSLSSRCTIPGREPPPKAESVPQW